MPFYGNEFFHRPLKYRCVGDCYEQRMKLHFGNLVTERELAKPYDVLQVQWEQMRKLNPNYED